VSTVSSVTAFQEMIAAKMDVPADAVVVSDFDASTGAVSFKLQGTSSGIVSATSRLEQMSPEEARAEFGLVGFAATDVPVPAPPRGAAGDDGDDTTTIVSSVVPIVVLVAVVAAVAVVLIRRRAARESQRAVAQEHFLEEMEMTAGGVDPPFVAAEPTPPMMEEAEDADDLDGLGPAGADVAYRPHDHRAIVGSNFDAL